MLLFHQIEENFGLIFSHLVANFVEDMVINYRNIIFLENNKPEESKKDCR